MSDDNILLILQAEFHHGYSTHAYTSAIQLLKIPFQICTPQYWNLVEM